MSDRVPDTGGLASPSSSATEDHAHTDRTLRMTPGAEVTGGRVARGVLWSTSGRILSVIAQLAATIALARLLSPASFGDAAITQTMLSFALLLADVGLGLGLVSARSLDIRYVSTAFWLNCLLSVTLTTLSISAAPFLADMFGRESLHALLTLAAFGFIANFGSVHLALLQRRMRFRVLAAVDVTAQLVSLTLAIVLALAGRGAESIVIGALAGAVVRSTLGVICGRSRVRFLVSKPAARYLIGFARGVIGSQVVNYWARNVDNLLIGKLLGVSSLGYYDRAYRLVMLPIGQLITPLSRVLFPTYAALVGDPARLKRLWLKSAGLGSAVAFPACIGLACVAPNLVSVLYGDGWGSAVPVLVLLALSTPPQIIVGGLVSGLYQATGRTDFAFRVDALQAFITVGAIAIGLQWGINGVAAALLVKTYLAAPISFVPALRLVGCSFKELERQLRPSYFAALVMAATTAPLLLLQGGRPALLWLVLQVCVGASTYVICLAIWGRVTIRDALSVLRQRRS
jgi:O-antigen/teichoic acid export membrane protein